MWRDGHCSPLNGPTYRQLKAASSCILNTEGIPPRLDTSIDCEESEYLFSLQTTNNANDGLIDLGTH